MNAGLMFEFFLAAEEAIEPSKMSLARPFLSCLAQADWETKKAIFSKWPCLFVERLLWRLEKEDLVLALQIFEERLQALSRIPPKQESKAFKELEIALRVAYETHPELTGVKTLISRFGYEEIHL